MALLGASVTNSILKEAYPAAEVQPELELSGAPAAADRSTGSAGELAARLKDVLANNVRAMGMPKDCYNSSINRGPTHTILQSCLRFVRTSLFRQVVSTLLRSHLHRLALVATGLRSNSCSCSLCCGS